MRRSAGISASGGRVLVNALSARTGGGLTYAYEQLRSLAQIPELDLSVLATDPLVFRLREACPGLTVLAQPPRSVPVRVAWEQLVLPRLARDYDVVYLLGNFALLAFRGPQVVVLQNPNHFGTAARTTRAGIRPARPRIRLAIESAVARASVRRATWTIAVSETLRSAVQEDLGEVPNMRVILSGVPELPTHSDTQVRRYTLFVANDYPHKDWDKVIATFTGESDLPPLVLVGQCRTRRRRRALERSVAGLERVSLRGTIQDRSELARLYQGAICFLAHSRLEAFPLTPYEAISQGLPVAASDIAAHREVCGPRAIYYDPDDWASLAQAVRRASQTEVHKNGAGLRTWTENATAVAEVLAEAAGS